jgi:hypothetical protein
LTAKEEDKSKLRMRQLFCERYDFWKLITEQLGFQEKLVNAYRSVATYKPDTIPLSSLNLYRRLDSEAYQKFNENFGENIADYDFLIDLDSESFSDAYYQASVIKSVFDDYKLPYSFWNSSSKGFHFVIEGKYFDIPLLNKPNAFAKVSYNLKGIYELKGIDTEIFDFRRIVKLPYSFNCGDSTIVLPLSDENFEKDLKIHLNKYLTSNSVLNRIMIKNRGLLTRNLDLSEEQLEAKCKKFIKDFG